jgi:hypothetical protein
VGRNVGWQLCSDFLPMTELHRFLVFLLKPEHRLRNPSGSRGSRYTRTLSLTGGALAEARLDSGEGTGDKAGDGLSSILMISQWLGATVFIVTSPPTLVISKAWVLDPVGSRRVKLRRSFVQHCLFYLFWRYRYARLKPEIESILTMESGREEAVQVRG